MLEQKFVKPTLALSDRIKESERSGNQQEIQALSREYSVLYKNFGSKQLIPFNIKEYERIKQREDKEEARLLELVKKTIDNEEEIFNLAEYYASILDAKKFDETLEKIDAFDSSSNTRFDALLCKMRIFIILNNKRKLKHCFEKALAMVEEGIDWDHKNNFFVYSGIYYLMRSDFKKAADSFYSSLASFSSEELFPFKRCVFYFNFSALLSYDRKELYERVLLNPEVLKYGYFLEFTRSFYSCEFQNCFSELARFVGQFVDDPVISVYVDYFTMKMKVSCYSNFFFSYKSVLLEKMANEFNVSTEHLEQDLRSFVLNQELRLKIDKLSGTIFIDSFTDKKEMETFKSCNKLQKLIRKQLI